MHRAFPLGCTLLTVSAFAAAAEQERAPLPPLLPVAKPVTAEAQPIFDGKTLAGWKQAGDGKWSVDDGAILGETGGGGHGWLIYEEPLTDFVLRFEGKFEDHGNSGIQIRSHMIGEEMYGYQADFDPDGKIGITGAIYEEGPGLRGWLAKDAAKAKETLKPMGEWNQYEITAAGDRLRTRVNGQVLSDIRDYRARSGLLALQVHSGKEPPVKVRFRNLQLLNLANPEPWTPLFNGKDLTGWHTQGERDVWTVQDGQIIGELVKPSPYAYLATDKRHDNFELKLEMKFDTDTGNSGVFFRCSFPPQCASCGEVARKLPEDADPFKCPKCGHGQSKPMRERVHIHGPQAEFAPAAHVTSPTAVIYDARGHGWVNLDKIDDHMRKMNRNKEWNELRMIAWGDRVITWLNGWLVSDISDYDFPDTGIIALQMHETKEAIKVRFRNLQIRQLPAPPATQP